MTFQVTSLLKCIWSRPLWRENVLTTFERWVQDGASRKDVKNKLPGTIEEYCIEQAVLYTNDIDLNEVDWDQLTEFLCTCF